MDIAGVQSGVEGAEQDQGQVYSALVSLAPEFERPGDALCDTGALAACLGYLYSIMGRCCR